LLARWHSRLYTKVRAEGCRPERAERTPLTPLARRFVQEPDAARLVNQSSMRPAVTASQYRSRRQVRRQSRRRAAPNSSGFGRDEPQAANVRARGILG